MRPVARDIPISQVRLLEKYPSEFSAAASAASKRVAEAVNSGRRKPRSPANPQQPVLAGIFTRPLQARATASSFEPRLIFSTEQTVCSVALADFRRIFNFGRSVS